MNRGFWKNKRILVTGHTGFKGGWLSLWLADAGATVAGYSLEPPTQPSFFKTVKIENYIEHHFGDVRDLEKLKKIIKDFKPEVVFHLAAQSLVRSSYKGPIETYSTNVMGTLNILEAVRCADSVQVAIIVTSDKCYENKERDWGYKEDEPMGGFDLYSSSKGCVELLVSSYRRSFFPVDKTSQHGVHVATARAGNVIGGGDWSEDRLIPDIIRAFLNKQTVNIRYPDAIRPWQHVLEPLSGYLLLAEKMWSDNNGSFSDAWNFGPDESDEKPVNWIVEHMINRWGEEINWTVCAEDNPHEANLLKLNCAKAYSELNWTPKWSLDNALNKIIEWYRDYQSGNNLHLRSLSQITDYEKDSCS